MTSVAYLQQLLDGHRGQGHFMMPLVKQFCTIQTDQRYGQYSQDHRVLTRCQIELNDQCPLDGFNVMGYPYREAGDCGMPIEFPENGQPIARGPLVRSEEDLDRITWADPRTGPLMSDRIAAIARFKQERPDMVVIGAVESPFALAATFMGLEPMMLALYDQPPLLDQLVERIEPLTIAFADAQIDAGADMMFMGDSIASQIGPDFYVRYAQASEKRIVAAVQRRGVPMRLHICGDLTPLIDHAADTGARMIDVDYAVDLAFACQRIGERNAEAFVVGNFDPVSVLLTGTPDDVRNACRGCEQQAAGFDRFILSPGCEVPPETPLANYRAMLEFGWKPA